eukprot:5283750-Alexandrium_andersonii.AAC.1
MVAERGSAEPRSAALRHSSNGSVVSNAEPYSWRAAGPQPRGLWLLWGWAGGSGVGIGCSSNGSSIGSASAPHPGGTAHTRSFGSPGRVCARGPPDYD